MKKEKTKKAKSYYYAVKKGRVPGVYTSWDECKLQTNGFSNAVYKKFSTYEEAAKFAETRILKTERPKKPTVETGCAIAYVDGSYSNGVYGSGIVFIDSKTMFEKSFKGTNAEAATMHNVAGEIEAAKWAISNAIKGKYKQIDIYYDYIGIEHWATGKWKTNKLHTKLYAQFISSASEKITIKFHHVKGHSGNKLNDLADKLAKEAVYS